MITKISRLYTRIILAIILTEGATAVGMTLFVAAFIISIVISITHTGILAMVLFLVYVGGLIVIFGYFLAIHLNPLHLNIIFGVGVWTNIYETAIQSRQAVTHTRYFTKTIYAAPDILVGVIVLLLLSLVIVTNIRGKGGMLRKNSPKDVY